MFACGGVATVVLEGLQNLKARGVQELQFPFSCIVQALEKQKQNGVDNLLPEAWHNKTFCADLWPSVIPVLGKGCT